MLTVDSIEKTLSSLSQEKASELHEAFNKLLAVSKKKKVRAKKPVQFPSVPSFKINNFFVQIATKEDVIKHFTERILPDLLKQPTYIIKANLVSLYEMLASTEIEKEKRDIWRQRAARIVMLDNQRTLIAYLISIATGIRTT